MMKGTLKALTLLLIVLIGSTDWRAGSDPRAAVGQRSIGRERRVIPGYDEPNTPPNVPVGDGLRAAMTDPGAFEDGALNLNRAIYVRLFDRQRTRPPRAIIILVPGIIAGANAHKSLGTQIVGRSGGDIEVWMVDRRANLLEDARAMIAAEAERTSAAALAAFDAYFNDPSGEGGYVANHPVEVSRFMAEWGLDVHLRDLKAVVEEARRSGADARPMVWLGGHDFVGADLVALFAAYDFDGRPGFTLVDGLLLLDGTPSVAASARAPQIRTDDEYLDTGVELQGALRVAGLNQLRHPTQSGQPPFLVAGDFGPSSFQLVEILAQLALFAPDEPSPLEGDQAPVVPSTNAAALAVNLDDEFGLQAQRRFSVGFLRVPSGRSVADVATGMPDPDRANPNGIFIPRDLGVDADGDPILQQWASIEDLSVIGLEGPELSDLALVAENFLYASGDGTTADEANAIEWFFPQRLLLDILLAARLDTSNLSARIIDALTERGGNVITVTENRRVNLPVLGLSAEQGIFAGETRPFPTPFAFFPYERSNSIDLCASELEKYAHNDVISSTSPLVAERIIAFVNRECRR